MYDFFTSSTKAEKGAWIIPIFFLGNMSNKQRCKRAIIERYVMLSTHWIDFCCFLYTILFHALKKLKLSFWIQIGVNELEKWREFEMKEIEY